MLAVTNVRLEFPRTLLNPRSRNVLLYL